MAVGGGPRPSPQQAVAAAAAAGRRAVDVHQDAGGQAAAVCAERGHWDAVSALLQVCAGSIDVLSLGLRCSCGDGRPWGMRAAAVVTKSVPGARAQHGLLTGRGCAVSQSGVLSSTHAAPGLVSQLAMGGQLRLCAELLSKVGPPACSPPLPALPPSASPGSEDRALRRVLRSVCARWSRNSQGDKSRNSQGAK